MHSLFVPSPFEAGRCGSSDPPLEGPDYPWIALVDLLIPGAATTTDFQGYADELSAAQPGIAICTLTSAGRELLVSSFMAAGMLDYQAQQGSEAARLTRTVFNEAVAELFASLHPHLSEEEFRRVCLIAATRHEPPAGRA